MNVTVVWPGLIRDRLVQVCPQYRDKIEVYASAFWAYYDDSRDFMVRFVGINKDIPQLELVDSSTKPMVGVELNVTSSTFI